MDNKIKKTFDLSKLQFTKHSKYFDVYKKIFKDLYEKELTIIEIGVLHGGSIEAYKKIFPNSRIIGIDKNPKVKELEKYGFEIFIADSGNFNEMREVFNKIGSFDILIDDGGHTYNQQISSCEAAFEYANSESLILVEDTHTSYMKEFDNKSMYTFQNYAFNKVNKLNNNFFDSGTEKVIYSVEFFESITVFKINKSLTSEKNYNYKNKGIVIESMQDFRYSDIFSSPIYKKVQNFLYYLFRSRWSKSIMKKFIKMEKLILLNFRLMKTKQENKKLSQYFWKNHKTY
jgi:hypothetical protein